ncbi:MAG: ChbG/HpnK family deacetylase, partial [Eubacterium sp.]|nr:ChbG/HpnK family deacetylase [Eubacterium sp.]
SVNPCMEAQTCEDLYSHVNLTGFRKSSGSRVRLWERNVLRPFLGQTVKKLRKISTISAHSDYFRVNQIRREWMDDIEKQLAAARKESDLLVVLLHSGGQFNIEPGEYSKYMMDKLCELGADIVIGNHPHTVQRVENRNGKIVAYSLGGYCMSVSGEYLVHDCFPEYSLALHVDVDEDRKLTSSIDVLKGTEDENAYLTVKKAPEGDPGAEQIYVRAVTAEKEWKRRTLREAAAKRGGKPIRVVLSADDFGRSHDMNVAIDYAMRNGLVRSTALLMGSAFTQEAVEMAKEGGYLENVHCHLNLASCVDVGNHFVPLNDTFKKSRFCKDGEFGSPKCYQYYKLDFFKYKNVIFRELESQFLAFREMTEGKANYGHVDFHLYRNLYPTVALAYRKLIRVYGIKTARFIAVHEKKSSHYRKMNRLLINAIFRMVRRDKANVMKSSKIEYYIMRQKAFRDDSIVELYVHPEMRNGVIMDRTNSVMDLEMQTLEDQITMVKNLRETEFIPWSAVK